MRVVYPSEISLKTIRSRSSSKAFARRPAQVPASQASHRPTVVGGEQEGPNGSVARSRAGRAKSGCVACRLRYAPHVDYARLSLSRPAATQYPFATGSRTLATCSFVERYAARRTAFFYSQPSTGRSCHGTPSTGVVSRLGLRSSALTTHETRRPALDGAWADYRHHCDPRLTLRALA